MKKFLIALSLVLVLVILIYFYWPQEAKKYEDMALPMSKERISASSQKQLAETKAKINNELVCGNRQEHPIGKNTLIFCGEWEGKKKFHGRIFVESSEKTMSSIMLDGEALAFEGTFEIKKTKQGFEGIQFVDYQGSFLPLAQFEVNCKNGKCELTDAPKCLFQKVDGTRIIGILYKVSGFREGELDDLNLQDITVLYENAMKGDPKAQEMFENQNMGEALAYRILETYGAESEILKEFLRLQNLIVLQKKFQCL